MPHGGAFERQCFVFSCLFARCLHVVVQGWTYFVRVGFFQLLCFLAMFALLFSHGCLSFGCVLVGSEETNLRVRSRTRERSLRTVTHQRHELITCGLELRPLPKHLHARAALEKAVNLALDFRWDLGAGLDLLGCHDTESLQVRSQTLQPPAHVHLPRALLLHLEQRVMSLDSSMTSPKCSATC